MKKRFYYMAKLVEKARKASKKTQQDLSKVLGYKNAQFISNVERALCGLPADKFREVSILIDVPIADLIKASAKDHVANLKRTTCLDEYDFKISAYKQKVIEK